MIGKEMILYEERSLYEIWADEYEGLYVTALPADICEPGTASAIRKAIAKCQVSEESLYSVDYVATRLNHSFVIDRLKID